MPPPLLPRHTNVGIQSFALRANVFAQSCYQRHFSTSPPLQRKRNTLQRKRMLAWLRGPGKVFKQPLKGSTNYLSAYDKEGNLIRATEQDTGEGDDSRRVEKEKNELDVGLSGQAEEKESRHHLPPETLEDLQPFPLNPFFRSPSVLSDRFRDEIYNRIMEQGQTIRQVSQDLGVEMARVAAVVRLRRVELDWLRDDKPLAVSFHKIMMDMLPKTEYDSASTQNPYHESINDLPVHQATLPQIFHPAPEAMDFTRRDAGKVFHRGLLPAEDRIPHPDLVETAREEIQGMPARERTRAKHERWEAEQQRVKERQEAAKKKRAEHETVVKGKRWDFKFERVHADKAIGWRYGMPLEDRKKGQVKIPTRVE